MSYPARAEGLVNSTTPCINSASRWRRFAINRNFCLALLQGHYDGKCSYYSTETKLLSRNLIKGINTRRVPLVRYSGPFLKWTKEELEQMDQRTRKLMTMDKVLPPRVDTDRLYASRKEGKRGLDSIQYSVDASIQ